MGEIDSIPNHQVKVDNWPLFFLQRLHHFYRKKSHCDLTLLFSTLDTIKSVKVHKLVLHACTDYFESLDIMKDSEHGEFLQLSNEMQSDVVIPIIGFMYTGKLEFPVTLQPRLYEAATKLRMTILTKLLDVQPNKSAQKKQVNQMPDDSAAKAPLMPNEVSLPTSNVAGESNQDVNDFISSSSASGDVSVVQSAYTPSSSSSKQIEEPIVTLIPVSMKSSQQNQSLKPNVTVVHCGDGRSTNQIQPKIIKKSVGLQLATVNAKQRVIDVSLPPTLPGRKLPVWKRKVPLTGSQFLADNVQNIRTTFRPPEKPRPTRFEWEDDLNDPTALKPVEDAFNNLSHDGSVKVNHPIILEPDGTVQNRDMSDDSSKRSFDGSASESPPYKRSKSDLQDMKEYGKQQQLRNEIICSEENDDDMMDTDDLYGPCDEESDELTNFSMSNVNSSTPKPILKTVPKPEPPSASKRVRFSLEGKENNSQQSNEIVDDFTAVVASTTTTTTTADAATPTAANFSQTAKAPSEATVIGNQKIVLPMNASQLQSGKHHVKIVSEVLKKYPNLAKRENIKLRVVSKNPAAVPPTVQQAVEGDAGSGNKSASSMVSYIFLTNKGSGELLPIKSEPTDREKVFDVENRTGPWFCQVCQDVTPIEFGSYYEYRRHLVEVHEVKIDARICEYCGLKSSKRNHLLYHLYTKHGVDPPAHVTFPKCPECNYIALSEALLLKHKSTHDPKVLACYTCNVVFKSYAFMQIHLQSSWHKNKLNEKSVIVPSDYPCPFCECRFANGNELKDHIETSHHSQLQFTEEAEASGTAECTENPPSSELESLSNVASGIATSLSLVDNEQTVVYYDQKTDGQDIGREATVVVAGDECKDYVMAAPAVVEDDSRQCQSESEDVKYLAEDNDDSNSRTSNPEGMNRTTCSDHDYSEPQSENNLRQIIPVHPVSSPMSENTVIQQIIQPDQRLVFSSQANVVFQSPCVTLPQRVLLTSGNVVLPRITTGDQNMIISKVIPQAPVILSGQIIQQTAGVVEDGSGGSIVFATSDGTDQMENIQVAMQQYATLPEAEAEESMQETKPEVVEGEGEEATREGDDESQDNLVDPAVEAETTPAEAVGEEEDEDEVEEVETVERVLEGVESVEETAAAPCPTDPAQEEVVMEGEVTEGDVTLVADSQKAQAQVRVETSKIVDDWDETNDAQQSVESRSDGPSRPDFF